MNRYVKIEKSVNKLISGIYKTGRTSDFDKSCEIVNAALDVFEKEIDDFLTEAFQRQNFILKCRVECLEKKLPENGVVFK